MSHEGKITYRKGYFPFGIYDYDTAIDNGADAANVQGFSLTQLTRMYWMAKSFDWSTDIVTTYTDAYGTNVQTSVGSGTTNILPLSFPSYPASFFTPQVRTGINTSDRTSLFLSYFLYPVTTVFTSTGIPGSPPDSTTSGTTTLLVQLFSNFFGEDELSDYIFATKDSSGNYLSMIAVEGFVGGATPPDEVFTVASGATLKLKMDGTTVTTPLYKRASDTTAAVGSLTLTFNNFWTP
jgi:hypothetical protein